MSTTGQLDEITIKPLQALVVAPGVVALSLLFVGLNAVAGSAEFYIGFLFALYWLGIRHADPKAFPGAVAGAVFGLVVALALQLATRQWGMVGGAVLFLSMLTTILFFQFQGAFKFFINDATTLILIAATIPHIQNHADFKGLFISLALGIVYFRGLAWGVAKFGRTRAA